jgi:hypothetical protein
MNLKLHRRAPVSSRVSSSTDEEINDAAHADELAVSSLKSSWPLCRLGAIVASPELNQSRPRRKRAHRNPNLGETSPPICFSFIGSQSNGPYQLTYPNWYRPTWAIRSPLDPAVQRAYPPEPVPPNQNTHLASHDLNRFKIFSNVLKLVKSIENLL